MIAITAIFLMVATLIGGCGNKSENEAETVVEQKKPQVEVNQLQKTNKIETIIKLTGTTKPATRVSLIALAPGTVVDVPLEVGAEVTKGLPVAFLYDLATESNFSTALNNFENAQRSLNSTNLSATETVTQAQLALNNAEQALDLAELNYQVQTQLAEENLNNTLTNAVISAESALDTVYVSLITFNDVLSGIPQNELSSLNPNLINIFDNRYDINDDLYDNAEEIVFTNENIEDNLNTLIELISYTQETSDLVMEMINKTPSSNNFPQATKDAATNSVFSRQNSLAASQTSLQSTKLSIITITLNNQTTLQTYFNLQSSAQIQLQTSQSGLTSAQQTSDNQIANAEISFERSQYELSLASIQKNRLTINSPLGGVISQLNVEVGDEISPGQILGEIAQIEAMEIEVEVSPEVASVLEIGQTVKITDNGEATISVINPTADAGSGKVKVKVTMPNEANDLIAESFATVEIPVSLPASQENIFIVPLKSVYLSADTAKAKIVQDGKIKTLTVKTGKTIGEMIEILEGFKEGQQVVINGADFLADETEVEIKTSQ